MATDLASFTQSYLVLVRFRGISGSFGPAMGPPCVTKPAWYAAEGYRKRYTNLDRVITVGLVFHQYIIPGVCVPISIVQLTKQVTKVEIDALAALIHWALNVAHANIFHIFWQNYMIFEITSPYRVCGSALLGWLDDNKCRSQQWQPKHFWNEWKKIYM